MHTVLLGVMRTMIRCVLVDGTYGDSTSRQLSIKKPKKAEQDQLQRTQKQLVDHALGVTEKAIDPEEVQSVQQHLDTRSQQDIQRALNERRKKYAIFRTVDIPAFTKFMDTVCAQVVLLLVAALDGH